MKNLFKVALATIALAGMSGAAKADLNFNGEVGLPINPTAQIPQVGGFRLQGNYYDLGGSSRFYSVGGAIRASATSPLEVNGAVNYIDGGGNGSDTRFSIGAKYLFSRETEAIGVRTAAGIGYSQFGSDLKNYRAYLVASKSFGNVVPGAGAASITGHLGVRYDKFDIGGVGSNSNKASIFAGVEVPVTRTGEVQVIGELGTKVASGAGSPYSLGLRYRPAQRPFGATIGIQRIGIAGGSGRVFAQLGYTFGK